MAKKKPQDHPDEAQQHIAELTADLQRIQADFINYRNRIEEEKRQAADTAKVATVLKILPVIDTIERAIVHIPAELAQNSWAQGVASMGKNLDKSLAELGLQRIEAAPGTAFNPNLHEAVMMDEDAQGEHEVIAEELRPGYVLNGQVARPSMVKVTRQ